MIGLPGSTRAACLALLLTLLLLTQRLLAAYACVFALGQQIAGRLPFQRALPGVERVIAAITAQPVRRQFQDALHRLEQAAVMADHHQATAPRLQLIHQPLALRAIQMIAGLIQNQQVRLGQKRTGQRHAHRFAAAELRCQCIWIAPAQTLPFEFCVEVFVCRPALADQFEIVRRNATGSDPVQRIQQRRNPGQFGNALPRRNAHPLRQVMHTAVAHAAPGAGQQLAGQQAPQYALAHTIAPDQAGGALVDVDTQIGK